MKLEPLFEKLIDDGLGKRGKSIFMYHMPESVSEGILLLDSLRGTPIDHELPLYYRAPFQIIVRHKEHVQGIALARSVMDSLDLTNTSLPGMNIKWIRAKHEPVVFPASEGDYLEISVNYEAVYVAT